MKIIIAGGSGHLGRILCETFHRGGDEVRVLSRNPKSAPWRMVRWDGRNVGDWCGILEDADILINLAGRSVNCRYGERNRRLIMDSRLESTRVLGKAIGACASPPKLWLQAATATIYAHRFDAPNDEKTGIPDGNEAEAPDKWRFSVNVAQRWEAELLSANVPETRKVLLRSAIVMTPHRGGPFDILSRLVRMRLGGKAGDGRQFVSWIHYADFTDAIRWIIKHPELDGPVNLASPNPIPNATFMEQLREAWGVRLGLPASRWMLEVGTFFLRTETELILKSRRVTPTRLLESGFTFRFPEWPEAATDLRQRHAGKA